jgi:ankyrin repeat protein
MHNIIIHALLTFSILASTAIAANKPAKALSSINAALPGQNFLTLSLRIGKLLEKADYSKRLHWWPAIENDRSIPESIKLLARDPKAFGINVNAPTHLFVQIGGAKNNGLILGALAVAEDRATLDAHLDAIADNFDIESKKTKGLTFRAKENLPFLTAQRGRLLLFLLAAPSAMESPLIKDEENPSDVSEQLKRIAKGILDPEKKEPSNAALTAHLNRPYDLALYFDYGKLARFAQRYTPDEQFKRILQALDVLGGHLSLTSFFNNGHFTLKLRTDKGNEPKLLSGGVDQALVKLLPGNAMSVGGLSIDRKVLKKLMRLLVENESMQPDEPSPTPAPELDLLNAFGGDFVFALSKHGKAIPALSSGSLPDWTKAPAAFFVGAKIGDPRKLDLLLSYANKSNLLNYTLSSSGMSLERNKDHLFVTTPDHRREILSGKPLNVLPRKEQARIAQGPVSARLDLRAFSRSLRQAMVPHYEFLMAMEVLEEFDKVTLSMNEDEDLLLRVSMRDQERNALATLVERWETEFTDRRNTNLFRAISENDLRGVDQQIRQGALVNAPDRSGHTPMHFAAYKGSPEVFQYLLRNGGRIDVRGRHKTTPLHSAAWGRNRDVVKVLIENGADVHAKTEEGETPSMTAVLRGEQETLEIFLSLAADPQDQDKFGTGLLELAAAGGHEVIAKRLQSIGVKTKYPGHVAAGLGDENTVRKLLASGMPIDQRDGFGATPLIFAAISGKNEIFDLLLSKKADPNVIANEGYTLMHAAAFSKDKKLISRLIDLGLDVNARHGDEGITPVDVAHEDPQAVELLRIHGGKTSWELGRP